MSGISPYRIAGLLGMAAVIVLVGWNSLRSEGGRDYGALDGSGSRPPVTGSPPGQAGGSGGFEIGTGGRGSIVVDVSGAVRRPGVYRFDHGRRVIDAIRRAGGATGDAVASAINRAARLADGQQVVVPSRETAGGPPGAGTATAAAGAPISLGTATQEQLEQIEGIGPVTAQSILEFRDSQGGVSSVDQLDEVSGIGPVTMEALRARLQP
jgi:competence protein ComEA